MENKTAGTSKDGTRAHALQKAKTSHQARVNASIAKKTGNQNTTGTKQSFGSAFKSARKSGKKVFTYKGKSYTTKLKSSTANPVVKKTKLKQVSKLEIQNKKIINTTATKMEKKKPGSGMDFVKVHKKSDAAKLKATGKIRQPWFNKKKEGPKSVSLTEGGAYAKYYKK